MKHLIKPECKFGCRFIQITDALWLCPHASYGEASYRLGAVEEARALVERSGGYDAIVLKLETAEAEKREAKREEREERLRAGNLRVRYDKGPALIEPALEDDGALGA